MRIHSSNSLPTEHSRVSGGQWAFLFKLVKALAVITLDRQRFWRITLAQFSQELVKGKSWRLEVMGDEGFEPATNRLRVTVSLQSQRKNPATNCWLTQK
ncbi:hypothetical protein [Nostoc sp.]|uniref:hypothetical protein n=1 Tax=Nostoc sp. TaxID=1180 RepID=UPI002FFC6529